MAVEVETAVETAATLEYNYNTTADSHDANLRIVNNKKISSAQNTSSSKSRWEYVPESEFKAPDYFSNSQILGSRRSSSSSCCSSSAAANTNKRSGGGSSIKSSCTFHSHYICRTYFSSFYDDVSFFMLLLLLLLYLLLQIS